MYKLPAIVALFLLAALPPPGFAAGVERLYEAEQPVSGQAAGERDAALRAALGEVLVRITGERGVLSHPAVQPLLADPAPYVQQYGYRTRPGAGSPAHPVQDLWVRFDGAALEREMRRQGLPFWGRERPVTLVWLAVEDFGERYLVSAESDRDVRRFVEQAARRRGIPVLFPLMDLEDQIRVRFADVWGGFLDSVVDASSRYTPQALLVGRLHRESEAVWSIRLTLWVRGATHAWERTRGGMEEVLVAGVEEAADRLAARFALRGDGAGATRLSLTVEDVRDLGDYARVSRYLTSLTPVRGLQVARLEPGRVEYRLDLRADLQALEQLIAIDPLLEPVPGAQQVYRLRP